MYINSLNIEKYKIFENLEITFETPKDNKNIVNVIAGVNGTGKTTLLELLYKGLMVTAFDNGEKFKIILNESLTFNSEIIAGTLIENIDGKDEEFSIKEDLLDIRKNVNDEEHRLIFMPIASVFEYKPQREIEYPLGIYKDIIYKIDVSKTLGNAELYIRDYIINQERMSLESKPEKRTSDAVNKFNMIFKDCDMSTKLIDVNRKGRPLFLTLNGEKITIEKLSSGEQQLYARVISLMILEPKHSIILIDEPEITLHPKLQQKIIKIYQNIGMNNQFIITTHSPHVLGSVENKSIRLLVVGDNEKIEVINDVLAYGRDINWVLKEVMGASYTREPNITNKIDECKKLLDDEKYDEAEKLIDAIEMIIGSNDREVMALRNSLEFWRE